VTDREKVIEGFEMSYRYSNVDEDNTLVPQQLVLDAIALLNAQEVVVRCKDCIYWKSNLLTHFWKPCDVVSTDKDWYCPCGKRR